MAALSSTQITTFVGVGLTGAVETKGCCCIGARRRGFRSYRTFHVLLEGANRAKQGTGTLWESSGGGRGLSVVSERRLWLVGVR